MHHESRTEQKCMVQQFLWNKKIKNKTHQQVINGNYMFTEEFIALVMCALTCTILFTTNVLTLDGNVFYLYDWPLVSSMHYIHGWLLSLLTITFSFESDRLFIQKFCNRASKKRSMIFQKNISQCSFLQRVTKGF